MRDDLLEAQASVDWAASQFLAFNARLDSWLKHNVTVNIDKVSPPATHDPIVAIEKELLPLAFNVEFGAYINAIRSSLDILAMALALRLNLGVKLENVQFPIAPSESAFSEGRYKGGEFVKNLPPDERSIISELRPYPRGNDGLVALHQLDITRKHRRLLGVEVRPLTLSIFGNGRLSPEDFVPLHNETGWLPVNEKTVLGLIRKGAPYTGFKIKPAIAITEVGLVHRKPVLATLLYFSELATRIIKRFDI